MRIKNKPSKWRKIHIIIKATIFLVISLIVVGSNLQPQSSVVLSSIDPMVMYPVEREANASVNTEEENRQKPKSLIVQHKDRVVKWLYNRTYVVPRNMLVEYVDFIGENVEPKLQPLVLAILTVESNGNPFAVSRHGACGITQIVPKYWVQELISFGIISEARDLFDYRMNIMAHTYILNKLFKDSKNLKTVLSRYNGSSSGGYAEKVISRLNDLNKQLPVASK